MYSIYKAKRLKIKMFKPKTFGWNILIFNLLALYIEYKNKEIAAKKNCINFTSLNSADDIALLS